MGRCVYFRFTCFAGGSLESREFEEDAGLLRDGFVSMSAPAAETAPFGCSLLVTSI